MATSRGDTAAAAWNFSLDLRAPRYGKVSKPNFQRLEAFHEDVYNRKHLSEDRKTFHPHL